MTEIDIVEELRDSAKETAPGIMMSAVREQIQWRAADEIEQLRADLAKALGYCDAASFSDDVYQQYRDERGALGRMLEGIPEDSQ